MLIALDYDKTVDAAPEFFWDFIHLARKHGIEVILATFRDDRYDRTPLLNELDNSIAVYYTRGVAKKWWLEQFAPEKHAFPDVWVDDNPYAIIENSKLGREGVKEWRANGHG